MTVSELEKEAAWTGPGTLWRLTGDFPDVAPVLISHGTYSNAQTCLPLARFLGKSRPVYVIEWRGRDTGPGRLYKCDYTAIATGEITQAINTLSQRHGPVHFVGHSGGGLALFLALGLQNDLARQLRSLTTMGAQATQLDLAPFWFRGFVRFARWQARRKGYWSVRTVPIGPCNEIAGINNDWVRWNRQGKMTTADGISVLSLLKGIKTPALIMAGAGDHHIAPEAGCRLFADALGETAYFHLCGRKAGDEEDFDHARMVKSQAAARTIWPRIATFLQSH